MAHHKRNGNKISSSMGSASGGSGCDDKDNNPEVSFVFSCVIIFKKYNKEFSLARVPYTYLKQQHRDPHNSHSFCILSMAYSLFRLFYFSVCNAHSLS